MRQTVASSYTLSQANRRSYLEMYDSTNLTDLFTNIYVYKCPQVCFVMELLAYTYAAVVMDLNISSSLSDYIT